jgi:putative two-component system response regulator
MNSLLKPTILIIDDSPEIINLISGLLRNHYKVKSATHGYKGLQIVQSDNSIDLILLDLMMPGLSGFEVCKQLKADPKIAEIPVIFLTSLSDIEDEQHGLELGAVDYITKPISPSILLVRVKNHIKLKMANEYLKHQDKLIEMEELAPFKDIAILTLSMLTEIPSHTNELATLYSSTLADQFKCQPLLKYFITEQAEQILHENQNKLIDHEIRDALITLAKKFKAIRLTQTM